MSTTEDTGTPQPFVAAAANGVLAIQRCDECATWRNPPAPMCGDCGSVHSSYQPVSGHARLLSWITSQHPTRPDDERRTMILVALDEGMRLVSNIIDEPEGGLIDGMELTVDFADIDGLLLPVFRPSGST